MATGFSDGKETQSLSIKKEDDTDSEEEHCHDFNLKLDNSEDKHNITCDKPQTILESIRSAGKYVNRIKDDQHVTIQTGEGSMDTAVATHFPCCLLKDRELVTLRASKEEIEKEREGVMSKEDYCLFYIETEPGPNAKIKNVFRSRAIKKFRKLCVYGVKGMTFSEALNNDGRFSDHLGEFRLADVEKTKQYIDCHQKINRHHNETFQICYVHGNKGRPRKAAGTTKHLSASKVFRVDEVLRKAKEKGDDKKVQQIYKRLEEMNPELRKKMNECFPDKTFQEALKKVDFGKAQQAFSECYQLEKLLKMGKSVCKLKVGKNMVGTAFVLYKNYILTNAHLLFHNDNLVPVTEIKAVFNYLKTDTDTNTFKIYVTKKVHHDMQMDYAVLELDESDQEGKKVPDGLMKLFSPLPKSGDACIIGHPNGEVKKLDIICIIQKEQREAVLVNHRSSYANDVVVLSKINDALNNEKQKIENLLMSDEVLTNHTFMYHGASGSPVFDTERSVVAMHTTGFVYDFLEKGHVLEFACPVLSIFESFVTYLKSNQTDLLMNIREGSGDNEHLLKILNPPEPMDIHRPQNPFT